MRCFDVREFSLAGGNLAVIENRASDEAPHQDNEKTLFYGRNGSGCYPLTTTQIKDILQRQKTPILEIHQLAITEGFAQGLGQYFILSFDIENVGKVVCQTHLATIRITLKFGSRPVIIDEHYPVNGRLNYYVDTESQSTAYVLKLKGGKIYSGDKVTKTLRILCAYHFDDRMSALCSRTENKVTITLFGDPPSKVKGQTQIPVS